MGLLATVTKITRATPCFGISWGLVHGQRVGAKEQLRRAAHPWGGGCTVLLSDQAWPTAPRNWVVGICGPVVCAWGLKEERPLRDSDICGSISTFHFKPVNSVHSHLIQLWRELQFLERTNFLSKHGRSTAGFLTTFRKN